MKTMSETSPFVLPTYQGVLNRTIANVIEELNYGDSFAFFRCLRTLWTICPPAVKEETKEDLQDLLNELGKANHTSSFDLYWTRNGRNKRAINAIRKLGEPLFEKLMESLHKHGFLLKNPVQPTRPSRKRLEV